MYMGSNINADIVKYEGSEELMPFTLRTITKKIEFIPNTVNRNLVKEFCTYKLEKDLSKNHQINNLKVVISFANYLRSNVTFHNLEKKEQILEFLDTKRTDVDVEKKWITTWNYYLNRLKLFFRWLYNRNLIQSRIRLNQPPLELFALLYRYYHQIFCLNFLRT
jgi:hypothetical protein